MAKTDTRIINHDLRCVNGGTIYMPKWAAANADLEWGILAIPDVYTSTTAQLYPYGTIYREGLRTFVYTHLNSSATAKRAGYLVFTSATHKSLTNAIISGAAGASTLVVNYATSCAVNKYAGGYLGMKQTNDQGSYYILSNTVQDVSNYVTFTLDNSSGWKGAQATTGDVVLCEDIYSDVNTYVTGGQYAGYVGALMDETMAAGEYGWVQTWGPHNMMSPDSTFEGDDTCQLDVFALRGAMQRNQTSTGNTIATYGYGSLQRIGFSLAGSAGSAVTNGESVFLQIMP